MATLLAAIMFRHYNASLFRQHTVKQSFFSIYEYVYISGDESLRIMWPSSELKTVSPDLYHQIQLIRYEFTLIMLN
jgi:hypothetical protein